MAHTSIQAVWSGVPGLPGYTTFRWADALTATQATAAAAAMRQMFKTLEGFLPQQVTVSWDGVAVHRGTDGKATGTVSYTIPDPVPGTATIQYSAASGACVNWITGLYVNGRRFRGRTFLVPLAGCYENNGTLTPTAPSVIANAAEEVRTSVTGMILNGGDTTRGYFEGPISGVWVADRAAVLRSRRD